MQVLKVHRAGQQWDQNHFSNQIGDRLVHAAITWWHRVIAWMSEPYCSAEYSSTPLHSRSACRNDRHGKSQHVPPTWNRQPEAHACRWSDSGTSLPRLQSADPTAFRGFRDASFEEARAGLQGMSLLERTASVGAMPGGGVPRSHTVAGNLQVKLLFLGVKKGLCRKVWWDCGKGS